MKDWLLIISLIVTVLLAYYPSWYGGLIWDDSAHMTRPDLRSLHGLFRIWFDLGATQQYYPLLHSAFWVQYHLWGASTLGYHLVNILLHATAAVMVLMILRRLAIPGAFLAAAIFALHPVHVESVAWITELKNTLSGVLYLGSALIYLHFDQKRRITSYAWALCLFIMGLLCKTVTATLPAALLVIFWWQKGNLSWRKDVLPLLPFFLLGASAGIFTAWVEHALIGAQGASFAFSPLERVLISGKAIWFYLSKLFWPANLTFIYPRWQIHQAAAWQYMFPVAAFALVVMLWVWRRRWRGPLAGFLFFAGTLFPVLGFLNVYPFLFSFVADHFQYLASLGIITLTAAGISIFLKRMRIWQHPVGYSVCILLLVMLAVLTWRQSQMYSDAEKLYTRTIDLNPVCWLAYNNRGELLVGRGEYRRAIDDFDKAIAIKPDCAEAYNNRGLAYTGLGDYRHAIEDCSRAVKFKPVFAQAYINRGVAYSSLGDYQPAIKDYGRAIEITPDYTMVYIDRGVAYSKINQPQLSIEDFSKAINQKPDCVEAYYNRGKVYNMLGRKKLSIEDFNKVILFKPDYTDAYYNRGVVYGDLGKDDLAIKDFNKVIRLKPDYADAYFKRGAIVYKFGQKQLALQDFSEVIRLKPDSIDAYYNRGAVYDNLGQYQLAIKDFNKVIRLKPDYADAYFKRGAIVYKFGQKQLALQDFSEVIRLKPDSIDAYFNRGTIYYSLEQYQLAIEDYDKILRLKPDYADAYLREALFTIILNSISPPWKTLIKSSD